MRELAERNIHAEFGAYNIHAIRWEHERAATVSTDNDCLLIVVNADGEIESALCGWYRPSVFEDKTSADFYRTNND